MHPLELCRTYYVMRLCGKLALGTMPIECFISEGYYDLFNLLVLAVVLINIIVGP